MCSQLLVTVTQLHKNHLTIDPWHINTPIPLADAKPRVESDFAGLEPWSFFEGKIPQCQEETQKKMMDSVTDGQQIRMNQKKIAKHEEWVRRNIVFLMMWSLDCMWKPFFSVHSGRWAAMMMANTESTRDHQNPHHDPQESFAKTIF